MGTVTFTERHEPRNHGLVVLVLRGNAIVDELFDEEYGRENGLYRESTDYFAHRQLEHAIDQLWEAGPPQPNLADAPRSSDEEIARMIRRQFQHSSTTFDNMMGGVTHRLNYISQNPHLRRIFNNTDRSNGDSVRYYKGLTLDREETGNTDR